MILWKHDMMLASHKKYKAKPDRNCFNRRKPRGTLVFFRYNFKMTITLVYVPNQ